ncbi:MAG: hypothetical protein H7123_01935 [Thermoleophilia bacterium]|nr:hypothetical protein [Thermoleophilia bacterium]
MPITGIPPLPKPRIASAEVSINADDSMTGHPTNLTTSSANASIVARYALDAPAGAQLRVAIPEGLKFNRWAWANEGKTGISFAKEGAGYVATTDLPITQLSLNGMHFNGSSPNFSIDEHSAIVKDVLPRLSVNGVAQSDTADSVTIQAPLGWKTQSADGSVDAPHLMPNSESLVAERDPAKGVATLANFTGEFNGHSTVGAKRYAHEAVTRAGDNVAGALYTAMMMTGLAP